jgi:predicted permease
VIDSLMRDLRFSVRALTRTPAFTAAAVLTLALGIGATAAIFTVVNAVLLRPLDYADPGHIVSVSTVWKDTGPGGRLSYPDYHDLHDQSGVFSAMAPYNGGEIGVRIGDQAEFTTVDFVGPEFFDVFRVAPIAGRFFSIDEQKPHGAMAAIVNGDLAARRFGSAANAVGKHISIMGHDVAIAGVLPAWFHFPKEAAVWVPISIYDENPERSSHNVWAVARLRPGITIEQANARMAALGSRLARQYPASNKGVSFAAVELRDQMVGKYRPMLWLLTAAVGLLFLIACANVASIVLARASVRAREVAVRAALGATRRQIVRQLIVEGAALSLAGGVIGVLLGWWLTSALVALAPANIPRLAEVSLDWRVLLFTVAITACATVLFSIAPALQTARVDIHEALRQGGQRGALGGASGRLRGFISAAQIALCFVLITGAVLLFRSFLELTRTDMGFRADHVMVAYAATPAETLKQHLSAAAFFTALPRSLDALPGVVSSAAIMGLPTGRYGSDGGYYVEGQPRAASSSDMPQALFHVTTPKYFATLGIPLLRGRDFDDRDTYNATPTVIISAGLARRSLGAQDPIGTRIQCGLDPTSMKFMTVVGVVGDVRSQDAGHAPEPTLYMPAQQHPFYANEMQVVVRTAVPPLSLEQSVRHAIHQLSPDTSLQFTTLDAMLSDSMASPRFRTALMAAFAAIAMALVLAGVYGLMSYTVALRSSELGLRMALGAHARDIGVLVMRRALGVTGWGLLAGAVLAFAAHRLIAGMLYGLTPSDPLSWVAALLLIAAVSLGAALVPARRAIRLDPVQTLRSE